jgi:hypothetical protein
MRSHLRKMRGKSLTSGAFSLGEALAPKASPSREGVAVAAIIRDEGPYIEEWVEFHAMLGASAFFIYDNGSTDDGVSRLRALSRRVRIEVTPWRSFDGVNGAQRFAYLHAIANFGGDYRWMALIDADEFLVPVVDPDLPTAMARFAALPGVSVPWMNFGPSGHKTRPSGLVIEEYLERAEFPPGLEQWKLLRFKSIVDPTHVSAVGNHFCAYRGLGPAMFNEGGQRIDPAFARKPGVATAKYLRLHHYFSKSEEELRAKRTKGRVSLNGVGGSGPYERRMAQYVLNTTRDETMLRFVPALKARLERGAS